MGKEMKFSVVSGAPNTDNKFIQNNIDKNSYIIAADSGYKKLDFIPNLIIGDFDSSDLPDYNCEIIKLNPIKDESDTFSCVREAVKRGATEIEIFGAIGNRIDHTLANIHSITYCLKNNVKARIIDDKNLIYICDKKTIIKKDCGYKYFSVYALYNDIESLTIKGAKYPLNNYYLELYAQLTVSNEVADNCSFAEVSVKNGKLLIILSND